MEETMGTDEIRAAVVQVSFGRFPQVDEKLVQLLRAQYRKEEDASMAKANRTGAKKPNKQTPLNILSAVQLETLSVSIGELTMELAAVRRTLRVEQRAIRKQRRKELFVKVVGGIRDGADAAADWVVENGRKFGRKAVSLVTRPRPATQE